VSSFQNKRSNSICHRAIDALGRDIGRIKHGVSAAAAKVPMEDDQKLLMAIDYQIRKFEVQVEKLRELRESGRISEAIWED
jgi:hypothetical protein